MLRYEELEQLVKDANLIERQLYLDTVEQRTSTNTSTNTGLMFKLDEYESDDGTLNCLSDMAKLKAFANIMQWIRFKMNDQEAINLKLGDKDLMIEGTGENIKIYTSSPSGVKQEVQPNDLLSNSFYIYGSETIHVFLEEHRKQSNTITANQNTDKLSFYTYDTNEASNLSPKGAALLQSYYSQKDGQRNDTFIGEDKDIPAVLKAFANAKDGASINILIRIGESHWVPIKLEKEQGHIYITEMDSLGTVKDFAISGITYKSRLNENAVAQGILNSGILKTHIGKVHWARANNLRQTLPNNCLFFASKDARMMQDTPKMFELAKAHAVTPRGERKGSTQNEGFDYQGIDYIEYLTPKAFMRTVDNEKGVQLYVDKYNRELTSMPKVDAAQINAISLDKDRKRDDIQQRVSHTKGGSKHKNASVLYFKDKYMTDVVQKTVQNSSLSELVERIQPYDIHKIDTNRINLTVDVPRSTSSVAKIPEKIEVHEMPKTTLPPTPKEVKKDVRTPQLSEQVKQKASATPPKRKEPVTAPATNLPPKKAKQARTGAPQRQRRGRPIVASGRKVPVFKQARNKSHSKAIVPQANAQKQPKKSVSNDASIEESLKQVFAEQLKNAKIQEVAGDVQVGFSNTQDALAFKQALTRELNVPAFGIKTVKINAENLREALKQTPKKNKPNNKGMGG